MGLIPRGGSSPLQRMCSGGRESGRFFVLDRCRVEIYLQAIYEADGGDTGDPRAPLARAALRLRHQDGGRPLDALLLGRELRPDLSGAAPARARGPDRGRGRAERRPRRGASTSSPTAGRRGARASGCSARHVTVELRDESLLRLFFADDLAARAGARPARGRRHGHEHVPGGAARDRRASRGEDPDFVDLVLRWGIDFNEWGAQWCQEQLEAVGRARRRTA